MTRSGVEGIGRLVLDTSAYSRFRGGDERALALIAATEIVSIPTIVLGELEAAFALGRRERENRSILAEFLAESFVSILPVTPAVARRYGRLFADLRRAGDADPDQRRLDRRDRLRLRRAPADLRQPLRARSFPGLHDPGTVTWGSRDRRSWRLDSGARYRTAGGSQASPPGACMSQ